jgi:hypothetical protein
MVRVMVVTGEGGDDGYGSDRSNKNCSFALQI